MTEDGTMTEEGGDDRAEGGAMTEQRGNDSGGER